MKKIKDAKRLSSYIESHDLQSYMDSDLFAMASLYSFEKDEHLIHTGTVSDFLYFLVKGTVMVYSYSTDAQNICIDYATPATPLGEASSLWELLPKSSVKAVTPSICVCIPLNRYRAALQQDVRFLQNICQLLSYRLNSGINLANSLTESVEIRLAKFILAHQKNETFSFQLTTCAAILNVSYRHLLRTITSFREANILEKHKNYYLIRDAAALNELAENLGASVK
ncbi:cyclic nucleotide-binding domain-containing protein [Enterococcus sp. CWB-B31]|uniref:cyclic nucleotide-binding domain-containing protein n=1 Tax=Enterococcus sp. CWB-B31 TaxID=2885159 RepID=UPI001E2B96C5|nr:cyclic nucleotide-binding domain-containing protein [Enterococcus sp. CWB-B31]MCB5955026.1 cyclic nucleotide-binding domain-containing protein [Enterococcus sp. CWB-B31]